MIFVFILCWKQIFLGTTKFVEAHKQLGGNAPECPPWLWAWWQWWRDSINWCCPVYLRKKL